MLATPHSLVRHPTVIRLRSDHRPNYTRSLRYQNSSIMRATPSPVTSRRRHSPREHQYSNENELINIRFNEDRWNKSNSVLSSVGKDSIYLPKTVYDPVLTYEKSQLSRHLFNRNPTKIHDLNSVISGGSFRNAPCENIFQIERKAKKRKKRRPFGGYGSICTPCCLCCLILTLLFLAIAAAAIAVGLLVKVGHKTTVITTVTSTTVTTSTTTTQTTITTVTTTTTVSTTTETTVTTTTTTTDTTTTISPLFNVNMLINGDAETGACAADSSISRPFGWDYDGDITQLAYNNSVIYSRVSTIPAAADPGHCLFYGHNSGNTSMWQTVALTGYADSSLIDTHTVKFNLSAWLGGFSNHNDRAGVSLLFSDQANQTIGNMGSIGPVTNLDRNNLTAFLFEQTTGLVPVGARFLTVMVTITKVVGTINDGYVDNIGIYLYQ